MEIIVGTGRRHEELEKPAPAAWNVFDLSRSIQRANLREYQETLDRFVQCWRRAALEAVAEFEENDDYEYKVYESPDGNLGETWWEDEEIHVGILENKNFAKSAGINFWHLLVQTSIHEWGHAEQGPPQPNHPWRQVELEFEAQEKAYHRSIAIYNHEPPQSYNTTKNNEEWDRNVNRYNELWEKVENEETMIVEEVREFVELRTRFEELKSQPAPFNESDKYYHFDLCG